MRPATRWNLARGSVDLPRGAVMGIVNVTPDSFSDGGRWTSDLSGSVQVDSVVAEVRSWASLGVHVVDVGGESTRPDAVSVPHDEELARVLPVLKALRDLATDAETRPILSLDTRHGAVAEAGVEAGAEVINDVSGLADPLLVEVAASSGAGLIIGHMRGTPQTMMNAIAFERMFDEVAAELERSLSLAVRAGVREEAVLVDPCVGFGKDARQSAALVAGGSWLEARLGRPVLIGASRKRFLVELPGRPVSKRGLSSVVAALCAVERGAALGREHDVEDTLEALHVRKGILSADASMLPRER